MRYALRGPGSFILIALSGCTVSPSKVQPPLPTTTLTSTPSSGGVWPESTRWDAGLGIGTTSGRFTVTAHLSFGRAGHTATLLPDGDILFAGAGQLDVDDLLLSYQSSELLSSSGAVTKTSNLNVPREFHAATLLQDGKVLITGGNVYYSYPTWLESTETAELFDPAKGLFLRTGSMSQGRTGHTASLLLNGRVLVVGGTDPATPSAEIYDPTKSSFSPVPNPLFARSGHTATVLASGKVLITGGIDKSGALVTAEIYDPATNSFKAVGNMAEARAHHTATLLPNGKVLVAGGGTFTKANLSSISPQYLVDVASQTAELFDPQTEAFTPAGSMNVARSSHTATLLPDGKVLLCGGSKGWSNLNGYPGDNTAEIYDPATGSFTNAGTMNIGKFWHTATLLPNGTVVLAGGIAEDSQLNVVETFR